MRYVLPSLRYADGQVEDRSGPEELDRVRAFVRAYGDTTECVTGDSQHARALAALQRLSREQAEFIVTVSRSSAHHIQQSWQVSDDKILVMPPRVRQLPVAVEDEVVRNLPPFLLFVGTPEQHKRLDLTCRALWSAPSMRQTMHVVVVGDMGSADLGARLQAEPAAAWLRHETVIRLGYVSDAVLRQLYVRAVATVLPSVMEGFCLPAAEAAQVGGRIVANDIPVLRETLRGFNSVNWIRLTEPASIISAVESALEQQRDKEVSDVVAMDFNRWQVGLAEVASRIAQVTSRRAGGGEENHRAVG